MGDTNKLKPSANVDVSAVNLAGVTTTHKKFNIDDDEKTTFGEVGTGMGIMAFVNKYTSGVVTNSNYINDATIGGEQGKNALFGATTGIAHTAYKVAVPQLKKIPAVTKALGPKGSNAPSELSGEVVAGGEELENVIAKPLFALSKMDVALGVVGVALNTVQAGFEYKAASAAGDGYRKARALGHLGGGTVGVVTTVAASATIIATSEAVGAAVGSFIPVPGVGTAVGWLAGAGIGGLIVWGCSSAGAAGSEAVLGSKWQASTDKITKAAQDKAIGAFKPIQNKYKDILVMDNKTHHYKTTLEVAQQDYLDAVKTNNPDKIHQAQVNVDKAAKTITGFTELSDADKKIITQNKAALVKAYVNEKSLQIPDSDHEAKKRQQASMQAISNSVAAIDGVLQLDENLKKELTPAKRTEIAKAGVLIHKDAQQRIAQIHHQAAAGTQQNFEQTLAKTVHPLFKYDKESPALTSIAAVDDKLKDPTLTRAQLDEAKQELAKLNLQKAHEEKEIAHVKANLAKERKEQLALLKDPNSKKFAAANIHHIDELQEKISNFQQNYARADENTQKTLQYAELAVNAKSSDPTQTVVNASPVIDTQNLSGSMKKAVDQVKADNGFSDAPIKNTTVANGNYNPVKDNSSVVRMNTTPVVGINT